MTRGSPRLLPTAPGLAGFFELVVGTREGKPTLSAQAGDEVQTFQPLDARPAPPP